MRSTQKIFLGLMLLIMLTVIGCKQNHCYQCYHYSGAFFAIKGNDTLSVGFILARDWFHDSVTHYLSLGYTIDTFANGYFPDPSNGAPTCNLNSNSNQSPVPDSCVIIM